MHDKRLKKREDQLSNSTEDFQINVTSKNYKSLKRAKYSELDTGLTE